MQDVSPLALASATVLEKRAVRTVQVQTAAVERRGRPANIKAFIIHLDRSRQRAPQVGRLMAGLPVEAEVIEAVDGNSLSQAEIDRVYRPRLHSPAYPFTLSKFEIACFLSHRKAWAAIVDQGLDAGFIIEDDVALDENFSAAFSAASACLSPGTFIRFPFRDREQGETVFARGGAKVIRPQHVGLGMVAQLVSREAAIRLLKATETFDRPVDTMVQMDWILHLEPLAVLPGGVSEISSTLGGSSIKRKARFSDKLAREVLRPLYRAKVALYSRYAG